MKKRRVYGNTMTEYGIIGFLILVACLVVVTAIGKNLNGTMQGLKNDFMKSANSANKAG